MTSHDRIEIALNKQKLVKILIAALLFVAIGFWFVINPPVVKTGILSNPTLIIVAGIISILFFGLCALLITKKLRADIPGLVIDETGITDNTSGISTGHIAWNDITNINMQKVMGQKILLISLAHPQIYIDQQTNMIKRKNAEINFKRFDSPVAIAVGTLKYDLQDLQKILSLRLQEKKR